MAAVEDKTAKQVAEGAADDTISLADSFVGTERSVSPPPPGVYMPPGSYPPVVWKPKKRKKRTLKVDGKVPDVLHVLMYYGWRHNEIIDSEYTPSIITL
jgi:hypothetical protein